MRMTAPGERTNNYVLKQHCYYNIRVVFIGLEAPSCSGRQTSTARGSIASVS
jgi:hypothetical protein